MSEPIELADVIYAIRNQLQRAFWASEHSDLRLSANQVELDLTIQVERDSAPGRVNVFVVPEGSQRIKLMLDLAHVEVHRSALISGGAEQDEI